MKEQFQVPAVLQLPVPTELQSKFNACA